MNAVPVWISYLYWGLAERRGSATRGRRRARSGVSD